MLIPKDKHENWCICRIAFLLPRFGTAGMYNGLEIGYLPISS